jgi:hypothetical protein
LATFASGGAGAIARSAGPATQRYEGPFFQFDYPGGASAKEAADVSADAAVAVRDKEGVVTAVVLAAAKRIGDGELEGTATSWHGARVKNRAAWGMKPDGGPPRENVRVGQRRCVRWRDRIGSVLGTQEQTMTCASFGGHLACVVVSAPLDQRSTADALTASLLGSLSFFPRR